MTTDAATPTGESFTCTLQVRWADFDQLSHVNNTKFLEYAQEARLLFFRSRFGGVGLKAPTSVVRRTELDFLRPVLAASTTVEVEIEVLSIGRTSYTLRHTIRDRDGAVCCLVDAVMVAFDTATSTAFEIPQAARAVLEGRHTPAIDGPAIDGPATATDGDDAGTGA